jgi:hypothetical protein
LSRDEHPDDELKWFERVRNMMFRARYDADSGWINASQLGMRRCIAFGTSYTWVDENFDGRSVVHYRHIPLNEGYIATDHKGDVNQFIREYTLAAHQCISEFGDQCSDDIKKASESATDKDRRFTIIQALMPRGDFDFSGDISKSRYQSVHIELDSKKIVKQSGFYEFPLIDFRWLPEKDYGEGPVMRALADIQSLNTMAKNEMIAGDQAVRPALLVANAGVMNRPNTNPGAINFGGLNGNGQEMVKPMFSAQRLDFATMVRQAKAEQVKDSMYLNLFQLLVKNPQMSATEAMIRANEKGELLGPAGARLQQSLSRMVERELGILSRRGAFNRGTSLQVPQGLQGKRPSVQFTSPLDRLRRAKEGEGILRLLETASPLAQIDPTVMDEIDPSQTLRQLRDILGAPVSILRDPKQVAEIRAQRAQANNQMQQAQIAAEMAKAGAQGSQALVNMKESGAL